MSVNKVILIGNVGKDPEVRTMPDGTPVVNFPLAVSEKYKDRNGDTHENTEWPNIVCWRGVAELVGKYVHKGDKLYVEGKMRTRSYDDKDGVKRYSTEINVDTIEFLTPKRDEQPQRTEPQPVRQRRQAQPRTASQAEQNPDFSDLPF